MSWKIANGDQPERQGGSVYAVYTPWKAVILPWSLLLFSWGLLVLAFLRQWNALLDHGYLLGTRRLPWLMALCLFLGAWQVMLLAMMLPAMLSRLLAIYQLYTRRWRAQAIFITSYASVWTVFALLLFLGDTLVHQLVWQWWWLYLHSQFISALIFTLAGIYQWSPLKQHCLGRCMATSSIAVDVGIQNPWIASWQQGWKYGMWCLGSNWTLMLVMFGVGMRSLFVMAGLAAIMWIEREMPYSGLLRLAIGGVCLLLALLCLWFPQS